MPTVPTTLLFPPVPCHRDDECMAPLPPEPAAQLVGIARLASSSPRADAKRGVEYFVLPAKSIVNRCESRRVPFPWSVNPYRGCEFGCKYCYARYTHEYMELPGGDFERKIFVKKDAGRSGRSRSALPRPARRAHRHRQRHRPVPARRKGIRRHARHSGRDGPPSTGLSVSITTKSNLVLRDVELLGAHRGALGDLGEYYRHHAARSALPDCSSRARRARTCVLRRCASCARPASPQACS